MRRRLLMLACLVAFAAPAAADTIVLDADRDATLIENPAGGWANGAGPVFFAGRTSEEINSIRRALIRFDVAGALPPGAVVEQVALRLYHTGGNNSPRVVRLYRVQAAWSEGASSASGGGGAPSGPGDATWVHASYDEQRWPRPGGQYVHRSSGEAAVGPAGVVAWEQDPDLVRDVRLWLAAPQRNFGWILIGDETTPQNSKRFASREHADPALRPQLEIRYRLPGAD